MMPFQHVNPDVKPPAICRPAEDLSKFSITRDANATRPEAVQPMQGVGKASKREVDECQISNRPPNAEYKVIYVNGIRTSEDEARRSAGLVGRSLGVEDSECSVVYNKKEHAVKAGIKILGATLSTKLGEKAESECVRELQDVIADTLYTPGSRLTVVGHSQGSLVIHNAFDKAYDEFKRFPETRKIWDQSAQRIEVVMFAPLVRTIAPGPEASALLNGFDLPTRGLGVMQRAVASSKHYLGYRKQQAIRTVIYKPESTELAELLFNPLQVHDSCSLILDNPELRFKLFSEDPKTRVPDAMVFTQNLHSSIRDGRLSDILHFELIRLGCDTFGGDFATPFMSMCTVGPDGKSLCIGKFEVEGARLRYLQIAAER